MGGEQHNLSESIFRYSTIYYPKLIPAVSLQLPSVSVLYPLSIALYPLILPTGFRYRPYANDTTWYTSCDDVMSMYGNLIEKLFTEVLTDIKHKMSCNHVGYLYTGNSVLVYYHGNYQFYIAVVVPK